MLTSFIALAIALFTQTLSRSHINHRERNTFTFISRTSLVISLVIAPWSLKALIVAVIFLVPSCFRGESDGLSRCSQHCIARSNCSHPHD